MKKNLRNSLKNWVKRIKWIEYELLELEEKLEYYESRMFHYKSPSFEPRISSNSFYQSNLDFWINKISDVETRIDKYNKELVKYQMFIDGFGPRTFSVFHLYFVEELKTKDILYMTFGSQYKFYYYMDKILKRYNIIITK